MFLASQGHQELDISCTVVHFIVLVFRISENISVLNLMNYLYREIARMLADDHKKRVVIIDTSNEIGGDGDVPHSGIGRARRMQVPNVNMQHNVSLRIPSSLIESLRGHVFSYRN